VAVAAATTVVVAAAIVVAPRAAAEVVVATVVEPAKAGERVAVATAKAALEAAATARTLELKEGGREAVAIQ
jgi:hypothetical protein